MFAEGIVPRIEQRDSIMLKITTLAIAATLTAVFLAPASPALAIDNGPCDHCTMEPIVVKGDRKKSKGTSSQMHVPAPTTYFAK